MPTRDAGRLVRVVGRIVRGWDETAQLRGLAIETPVASGHLVPGQFVEVSAGGAGGFFALANAPGEPTLQLLVKRGSPVADALVALPPGAPVDLTAPQGGGFPVDRHRGRDLLLLAAGAGIAPIRSVVAHVLSRRQDFGAVTVYYGQRRPDEFAYLRERDAWRSAGVQVVHVVSSGEAAWKGSRGRVQDALVADWGAAGAVPAVVPSSVLACVCGMPEMVVQVAETLERLGVDRSSVFLNV